MSRFTQVLGLLLCALFAASASAQQRPDYGTPVTVDQAKKIAAGIVAECKSNKWNVAVAVADTAGNLVYFERIDNTQTASMDIAILKARAAATYRRPTRAFADAIAKGGPAIMTLPGIVASPGGVPIMVGGKVIGAVGVSGVTGDQDEQCAKAGLAAM
jgi:uncharacterized protein GlcG (DUF336 family)